MSNASAAVRFPDGTIRYGIYHGTSDTMFGALFVSIDEAWENSRTARMWDNGDKSLEVFPVVIYSDYGSGCYWEGTATKDSIVSGFAYWGDYDDIPITNGRPDWLDWGEGE